MLDHLEANKESCDEANQKEMQRRRLQLESLQRPPRPKEHIFDGRWRKRHRKRRQGDEKKTAPSGRQPNWWEGRKVPDCLKGITLHSVTVMCNTMVHRVARGRRYGVISDGNKFHGLYHQALMKEEARQKTQRRKMQQQQEEAERVPWDYEEQNRANAELLLGLSTFNISYD